MTCPASGCSSRTIIRKMVVLPDPFGPTRPTFSPRKTLIAASRKRICLPCCLETESSRITRGGGRIAAARPLFGVHRARHDAAVPGSGAFEQVDLAVGRDGERND